MSQQMEKPIYTVDDYLPPKVWGRDHWSTLAYLETVMVDCGGFQVGRDPRMRANRRNFRVMAQMCPNPKRMGVSTHLAHQAVVMDFHNGSRLKDGTVVDGHDDWCCVQDMAHVGFFTSSAEAIEPKKVLKLSELGRAVCSELRAWKAQGGTFATFETKLLG